MHTPGHAAYRFGRSSWNLEKVKQRLSTVNADATMYSKHQPSIYPAFTRHPGGSRNPGSHAAMQDRGFRRMTRINCCVGEAKH
jgi:hypothetical protein